GTGGRVTLANGGGSHTVTIADNDTANVAITKISDGTEGVVTPGKFRVTQSAVSSTDTVVNYTIGGTAVAGSDYTPLTGTVTIPAGQTSVDIDVAVTDDATVEQSETVLVTLSSLGAHDSEITLGEAVSATAEIADNDTANVTITKISDGTEGVVAPGKFRVTQSAVSSTDTVVNYTIGGTATAGSDYTALTGTVTIPAGQTSVDIDVAVLDDAIVEQSETVLVTLSSLGAHDSEITLGEAVSATAEIADNDTATVSITKISDGLETNTPTDGKFRIIQSAVSSTDMVVNYTIGGTATAGADYTPLTGTVTIPAGQTSVDIDVAVLGDDESETFETVIATLASVVGDVDITIAAAPDHSATVTITDNDVDLTLTQTESSASVIAGSGPGNLTYTVKVQNIGQVDATGVNILEDLNLPAGVTVQSITPSAGTFTGTINPDGTWSLDLAAGSDATLVIVLNVGSSTVNGTDVIGSSVAITGSNQNLVNVADDSASENTSVERVADLSLTKSDSSDLIIRGQQLTYTIVVQNAGPSDVAGAVVSDTLSPGLQNVTWSAVYANSDFAGAGFGDIEHTVDIPAGGTVTYTVTGFVAPNAVGPVLTNSATVTSAFDNDVTNNTATVQTPIYQGIYAVAPGITLPKKGAPATVRVFDAATGEQTFTFQAYDSTYRDSIRVAVGDFNGDGFDDIVTSTRLGTGQVRVFDGLTGERISIGEQLEINPFDGKKAKGAYIAAGDVTGDGHDDLVISSAISGGTVMVYNGLTGAVETTYQPFGKKFKGGVRVAVGDVDGDGTEDIIAGQGTKGAGVMVFSGTSSTVLHDFKVGGRKYKGGVAV
ncbi:MAG: DUF11 domain-containing protein, partial [Verrucomicrobiaceae bacterium]